MTNLPTHAADLNDAHVGRVIAIHDGATHVGILRSVHTDHGHVRATLHTSEGQTVAVTVDYDTPVTCQEVPF